MIVDWKIAAHFTSIDVDVDSNIAFSFVMISAESYLECGPVAKFAQELVSALEDMSYLYWIVILSLIATNSLVVKCLFMVWHDGFGSRFSP